MRTRLSSSFIPRSFLHSIKCKRKLRNRIISGLRIDSINIQFVLWSSCEQLSNSYLFLAKIATRYVVSRPFSTPQCLRFGELTASWFTEEADRGAKQHRDSSGPLGFNYTLILFPLTFRVVGPCATHIAALSSVSCGHKHVYTYTRDQSTTNHRAIVFSIALKRSLEKKRDLWKSKNFLVFFFFFFFTSYKCYGTIRSSVIGDTICLNVSDSKNDNEC